MEALTHYSQDEPRKHPGKWKKPDTKGHILYALCEMFRQANPWRQREDWWLAGAMGMGRGSDCWCVWGFPLCPLTLPWGAGGVALGYTSGVSVSEGWREKEWVTAASSGSSFTLHLPSPGSQQLLSETQAGSGPSAGQTCSCRSQSRLPQGLRILPGGWLRLTWTVATLLMDDRQSGALRDILKSCPPPKKSCPSPCQAWGKDQDLGLSLSLWAPTLESCEHLLSQPGKPVLPLVAPALRSTEVCLLRMPMLLLPPNHNLLSSPSPSSMPWPHKPLSGAWTTPGSLSPAASFSATLLRAMLSSSLFTSLIQPHSTCPSHRVFALTQSKVTSSRGLPWFPFHLKKPPPLQAF